LQYRRVYEFHPKNHGRSLLRACMFYSGAESILTDWQIPGFLEAAAGGLYVDGADARRLAERFGTPLFIFSEARIRHNVARLVKAFRHSRIRADIFYASKANSNLAVLQVVRDTGVNIEVNSGGELFKALRAGFKPEQIVFNGVAKTEAELTEAIRQEIFCINVDSLFELERIVRISREGKWRANIALRIVPEIEAGTHAGLETGTHDTKFGIAQDEIREAYRMALQHPDEVSLAGLHVHIGAQVSGAGKHLAAFRTLLATAAELYNDTGHCVGHLNLGGGLPVPYIKADDGLNGAMDDQSYTMLRADATLEEVASGVFGTLEDWGEILSAVNSEFRWKMDNTRLLLEPGSSIIADTAVLVSAVQNTKTRHATGDQWLLLDAGFNTLLDTFSYNWYFHAVAVTRASAPPDSRYRLGGPLCDSADVYHDREGYGRLPETRRLPAGMAPGDLVAFLDVGGYTLEQMCQYNGQQRAAAVIVRTNGDVQLIRRRDTLDDLISHDLEL
jgi:diaminopimelate decarboxylase